MSIPDGLTIYGHRRDGVFMGELNKAVDTYNHNWEIGPHTATMRLVPNGKDVTDDDLTQWYGTRFMSQIRVHFRGAERWRGFVGKVALHRDGLMWESNIQNFANAVKCEFRVKAKTNDEQETWYTYYTNWFINEPSLKLYGNFEKSLTYSSMFDETSTPSGAVELYGQDIDGNPIYRVIRDSTGRPITEPELRADSYVKRWSNPHTQSISPGDGSTYIDATIYGPEVLADRILLSDGRFAYRLPVDEETWNYDEIDGESINQLRSVPNDSDYSDIEFGQRVYVHEEIGRIVDVVRHNSQLYGHEPLLYKIGIAENECYTIAGADKPTGAMTRLKELALLRNPDGDVYRMRIEPDGGLLYEKQPKIPVYFSYPKKGIENRNGDKPTWDARPEPIEIFGRPWIADLPETWLDNSSIIPNDRVTMRDGMDVASFGALEDDEEQFITAFVANQRRNKEYDDGRKK